MQPGGGTAGYETSAVTDAGSPQPMRRLYQPALAPNPATFTKYSPGASTPLIELYSASPPSSFIGSTDTASASKTSIVESTSASPPPIPPGPVVIVTLPPACANDHQSSSPAASTSRPSLMSTTVSTPRTLALP